jgi:hypothetical protein
MDKLLPLLALIVTASISVSGPAMAEWRFPGPLSSSFVTGPDAAVVLVAGKGSGGTTGGMGGSGGMTGFGGMTGAAGGSVGTTGNPPGTSVQPAYYTYECVTPGGQCSFAAPAALRSTSLRAGARCACAVGQPEGQIR